MSSLTPYAWIALGGALGSVARAGLTAAGTALWGTGFPWATLLINIAGSAIIGWFAVAGTGRGENTQAFVMAGLCGGFTTFSAFSLQTLHLLQAGAITRALLYATFSVLLCLLGTAAGAWLGK